MIQINGKHNAAVCFAATLDEGAARQIQAVCNQAEFAGCKLRIMPDVHAGKGSTIGTTMTITDKIVPGIETVKLAETEIDFARLDATIRACFPCGFEVRQKTHALSREIDLKELRCIDEINLHRASRSIGALGGGNHFIEVDRNQSGELYLVVHSGSLTWAVRWPSTIRTRGSTPCAETRECFAFCVYSFYHWKYLARASTTYV